MTTLLALSIVVTSENWLLDGCIGMQRGTSKSWKMLAVMRRIDTVMLVAMVASALPASAQESAASAPAVRVEVKGSLGDMDARRDFVAGKIIIGRKRIAESGMRTVEALLRREPAVTISGNGSIGLLNMPGYTQVLVDGQAPAGGQAPNQIDLVQVETIEIVKSSVAEYGPFGIAGTINIITRKSVRKSSTQMTTEFATAGGRPSANLSLAHTQSTEGSPLRYSFNMNIDRSDGRSDRRVRQTSLTAGQAEQEQYQGVTVGTSRSPSALVAGSVTWQRGVDNTVTVAPEAFTMGGASTEIEARRWTDGTTLDVQQQTRPSLTMLSLPVKWRFKPNKTSQVDVFVRTHMSRMETAVARTDTPSGLQPSMRDGVQHSEGRANNVDLGYKTNVDGGHDLKAGAAYRRVKSDYDYENRINGQPDSSLKALGTTRQSVAKYLRLFVQDEWRINDSWAANAGMSGQATSIDVSESLYRGQTRFRLWSPSLHVSKKLGADDKRQLRLSLARSFKAPQDDAFTVRPQIHPLAPCDANGVCGQNTIETADKSGNLSLRPEKSLGLNFAYVHGMGSDSQITFELFTRQIEGKLGTSITLETVPWSAVPRYVLRPANLGDARTAGINVEMELAWRNLVSNGPNVTLRASAGMASSRVASLPGPDNRLDKQTPWTAKLGGSYALPNLPVKFDVDASWTPGVWVRSSLSERVSIARRTDLDTSASWAIDKERRVVLSFKGRFPGTARQIDEYIAGDTQVSQYTDTQKYNALSVRFETKL